MAASRTSIVFVPGAWHTSFHLKPVQPYFERAGYRFVPCPLPAAGNKGSTCEENFTAIQEAVENELAMGQKVALILHSLAGISGCEAVNQILGPVNNIADDIKIIFVGSFIDWVDITKRLFDEGHVTHDTDENTLHSQKPYEGFFNDMSREAAKPFVEALTFQVPMPIEFTSDAWEKVSLTHVICERDESVLPHTQEAMAKQYGMKMVKIDAGHDPFISQPERFVELINGVIKG
ncbi:hypothetical protein DOTSEDRAFT_73569 [Dothistroma septosporum NZE10]|uniref:AB hydrolase-1 domain-containing protein n=1 Tax=Dothistroma septosporum (strain NZE10 / CBS 128990) TaxID=675120 RepID=N1PFR5_DOTSN|nr:hypothetical protein DOTSEDRAFT_73569 [Dothistroma septosporum NZE10]